MTPENKSNACTLTDWLRREVELKAADQPPPRSEVSSVAVAGGESCVVLEIPCCYYVLGTADLALNVRIDTQETIETLPAKRAS